MEELLRFRHNVMNISAIHEFENVKGGINGNCKDVYFVRAVGVNGSYLKDIQRMDDELTSQMAAGKAFYKRFGGLQRLASVDDTEYYSRCYDNWVAGNKIEAVTKVTGENKQLKVMLGNACAEIERLYGEENKQANSSITKNFIVKVLYWFDTVFLNEGLSWNHGIPVKLVVQDIKKTQEYLFLYMLTLIGCDVLLLQENGDICEKDKRLGLSAEFKLGDFSDACIPEYDRSRITAVKAEKKDMVVQNKIQVHIPERKRKNSNASSVPSGAEKSFEELAQLASSVVLIGIHDKKGEIIGSGSGIMIGEKGYILTNNHVASGGVYYSVRIEEDDNEYTTDEVIKYNPLLDLAVIRIQKHLNPLKIYHGSKKLVRGQKVVAIGSPLGLFNSVSDGIISGFRKINNVDMIQFTAPISHGSSGGAVLNMQGEVIGISTAGIDSGQNINLAMGYECINAFIRGFQ